MAAERNFTTPRPGPDTEAHPGERGAVTAQGPAADQRTGNQTGTIGGGGADAHNPDPVRATGVDDATARSSKGTKKRTTKKY
jgi:hypothetical protein